MFLFVSILFNFSLAQSPLYNKYTTNDGLPSDEVYQAVQDKNGLIWMVTDRGICHFDGYDFVSYSIDDGLTCNAVFGMFPQRDGRILCSTQNNKYFFINPDDRSFSPYQYNELSNKKSADHVPTDLYLDLEGNLSVGYINLMEKAVFNAEGKVVNSPSFAQLRSVT